MNFFIENNKYYTKGTLAHYLDTRKVAIGEPAETDLPETWNPLLFLLQNVFGSNLQILRLDSNSFQEPQGLAMLGSLLSYSTPAGQRIMVWIKGPELADQIPSWSFSEEVSMTPIDDAGADSLSRTGMTDSVTITRMG